ncbi:MAG: TIM-barrel domain-containing protein [bacterium]
MRIHHALCAILTVFCVMQSPALQGEVIAAAAAVVQAGNARFTVLASALIRLEWSPSGRFEDRSSLAFMNRRMTVPQFTTSRAGGWLTLRTNDLTLRYREKGGRFSASNLSIARNDGMFTWRPGMKDAGNLGSTTRTLDNVSGACALDPGLISRNGWALVDDSRNIVLDNSDWPWAAPRETQTPDHAADWYFFGHGRDYKRALADFIAVSGRPPMPPRFAFGGWWSRYWAYTDKELKTLVKEFRDHGVPLDVLVVDMDWHLDGWTGYTWNPKYFPDPAGFLKWAHDEGLRVTLNLHPADGVGKHEAAFTDVARAMGLDPAKTDKVPFDCADHRFVEAYFKYLHHPLERMGVDFWWIDWQQGRQSKMTGLDPLPWLNYLHWTDMERNSDRAGARPLIMSRWGGLGSHRTPMGFSGDTFCDWATLAFQPGFTAMAGNAGYGCWSHDLGGHQPGQTAPELFARWIQWGAVNPVLRTHGTKNPNCERRLWAFPADVYHAAKQAWLMRYALIPYIYDAWREYHDTGIPLVRPLYYDWPEMSEAYKRPGQYMFGPDIMAAPVAEPGDFVSSCALSKIWLPPGAWVNWFTGETVEGPRQIARAVPLEEIPLWVRAGAIIPTAPVYTDEITSMPQRDPSASDATATDRKERVVLANTASQPKDFLILRVYPGARGVTTLYEDDGATTGYLRGEFTRTRITMESPARTGRTRIVIHPAQGSYPGMPKQRRFAARFCGIKSSGQLTTVTINGQPLAMDSQCQQSSGWGWTQDRELYVRAPRIPSSGQIEIEVQQQPSATKERLERAGARRLLDQTGNFPPLKLQHDVLRALGVYPDVQVISAAGGRFKIRANLWLTRPVKGLSAKLTAAAPGPGWKPARISSRLMPLEADKPAAANIEFRGSAGAAVKTCRLDAELLLSADDFTLTVPIRRILFPSINSWLIAGPFDNPEGVKLGRVFPPETGRLAACAEAGGRKGGCPEMVSRIVKPGAKYTGKDGGRIGWRRVTRPLKPGADPSEEFFVDLHKVFGKPHDNAVAYALACLNASRDTTATLAIGSDDGVAVWLNGKEIHRVETGRAYTSGQDRIEIHLKKGANPLLLKISQGGFGWGFSAHVDAGGEIVNSD